MIGDFNQIELMRMIIPGMQENDHKQQNQANNQKQNAQGHRAGDWICVKCNNLNYSFRNRCNRCQIQTKKQNLLDNLLLMNGSAPIKCQFEENSESQGQAYKGQRFLISSIEHKKRVPFGDITNRAEQVYETSMQVKKKSTLSANSKPNYLPWTPFSNLSGPTRKPSGHLSQNSDHSKGTDTENSSFRGFNTVLLLDKNLETPKKEKNMARMEAEGCGSPENAKNVTKYLFDSEQKEANQHREYVRPVSEFTPHGEMRMIDVLFDRFNEDDLVNFGGTNINEKFNAIN